MGFFDAIFARGEAQKSAQLDARLAELNRASRARGVISEEELYRRDEAMRANRVREDEVTREFARAFAEEARERSGQIRSALEAPVNWTLKTIPWWAWALLAVWAAVQLGLPAALAKYARAK